MRLLLCSFYASTMMMLFIDFVDAQCMIGYSLDASKSCIPCPPGFTSNSTHCIACPPGFSTSPPATYANGTIIATSPITPLFCTACTSGYYSTGGMPCTPCSRSSYSNATAATSCIECGNLQWTGYLGATRDTACVCVPGTYTEQWRVIANNASVRFMGLRTDTCLECPVGAVCDGTFAAPYPLPGYWATKDNPQNTFPCTWNPEACVGGYGDPCKPGHIGELCGGCQPRDYYMLGTTCRECKNGPKVLAAVIIVLLFGLGGGIFLLKIGATLTIMTSIHYYQVLTILNRIGGDWPESVDSLLQIVAMANFDPRVLQLNCKSDEGASDFTEFKMMAAFPIAIFLGAVVAMPCFLLFTKFTDRGRRQPSYALREFCQRAMIVMLVTPAILYLPYSIRIFDFLNCQTLHGRTYSIVFPRIDCDTPEYKSTFRPLGMMMTAFFVAAFPLCFIFLFFWVRKRRLTGQYDNTFAIFWKVYRAEFFWWSLVVIARKFCLALSISQLREWQFFQGAITVLIWMMFMSFHFYFGPYSRREINHLDNALFLLMLTILTSFMLARPQSASQRIKFLSGIFWSFFPISLVIFLFFVGREVYRGSIAARLGLASKTMIDRKDAPTRSDETKERVENYMAQLVRLRIFPNQFLEWIKEKATVDQRLMMRKFFELAAMRELQGERNSISFERAHFLNNSSAHVFWILVQQQPMREALRHFLAALYDVLNGPSHPLPALEEFSVNLFADALLMAGTDEEIKKFVQATEIFNKNNMSYDTFKSKKALANGPPPTANPNNVRNRTGNGKSNWQEVPLTRRGRAESEMMAQC